MTDDGFNYSVKRYLPLRTEDVNDLWIREGDFFVSRANGSKRLVGRGTQAQAPPEHMIFPDTMMRLRFVRVLQETRWIATIWGSTLIRSQIDQAAKTTAGILKISQQDLARIAVPLPPISEQRAIVKTLEEQLSMVDQLEADITAILANAQTLRQSILHRAFTGQLIPQDPNDEPAEEILKRIAAERTKRSNSASKRRSRTA
jgi:type I restriction enzyme S subunit